MQGFALQIPEKSPSWLSLDRLPVSEDVDPNHITHFLLWIVLGILLPNKWDIAIFIMILWELFEYIIVYVEPLYSLTKSYWVIPETLWNETIKNKIIDMIVNILGYAIGTILRLNVIGKIL